MHWIQEVVTLDKQNPQFNAFSNSFSSNKNLILTKKLSQLDTNFEW